MFLKTKIRLKINKRKTLSIPDWNPFSYFQTFLAFLPSYSILFPRCPIQLSRSIFSFLILILFNVPFSFIYFRTNSNIFQFHFFNEIFKTFFLSKIKSKQFLKTKKKDLLTSHVVFFSLSMVEWRGSSEWVIKGEKHIPEFIE